MGGLLKYVTRAPDLSNYEFRVGGGFSDTSGAGNTGSILRLGANLPLVEGRFAIRASYALNYIPGYIDNETTGARDINEGEQESARLAMLWQITDGIDLNITAMKQWIDSDNNASVALDPTTLRPLGSEFGNDLSVDEPFSKDIDYIAATLNWDLGFADFTSATGYSEVATRQQQDATFALGGFTALVGLPPGLSWFNLGLDFRKITQELRLTSTGTGDFSWQVGAYYTEEDAHNSQVIHLTATDGTPTPILDPLAELTLPTDYKETAFFGNATYHLTEKFELGAGVRYASNEQDFWQVVTGGIILPIGTTPGTSDEDVFTWMLNGKYQLTDDAMLYARIATGYQPGGPNVALPNVPPTVDSSQLTNYELGMKSEFADNRALLDVALFYIDWDDIQITDSDGVTSWLVNGGKAASQGVEVTTQFQATDRLQLGLNVTYTDAHVTEDVPSLGGLDGDKLPFIPKLAWSANADYSFPLGSSWSGRVGLAYRWVDDRKTALDSDPTAFDLDSYGAADINADVGNEHWTISAYARNVTDERSYTIVGTSLGGQTAHLNATPIQPRTYGLEIDYRF
jgi:outer membrane receptor protein involved in Fe transport